MASEEQVGGVSDNAKVKTEKAMTEALSFLSEDFLVLVTGVIKNVQSRGLMLNKSFTREGRFIAGPTESMGTNGAFVHQGAPTQGALQVIVGSKGYVIYGTFDKALPQLGYLLAWSKPANKVNDIDKVYVEAGDLSNLMKMEWSEISEKLDASSSKSQYQDIETGAAATAEIIGHGDNLALLGASFDRSDDA